MERTTGESAAAGVPKLSRRLSALAEWVPEGAALADIGTDHALLPVYLALTGRIASAVAGDLHAGPVAAARRQVAAAGLSDRVSVRQGDGLTVIEPGEADTVCIAGMGGSLIVRLLEEAGDRLAGVRTLLLSPHVAEDAVRRWLAEHRFLLEREAILEEDGIFYTLLRARRIDDDAGAGDRQAALYDPHLLESRGGPELPRPLLYEMGPLLLRQPSESFVRKWRREIAKRENVIRQLRRSEAPDARSKAEEWQKTVERIREVLACLPAEKRLSNS